MRIAPLAPLALALALAACATAPADPTASLQNPQVTRTVAENGDVIEQYRVNGQLKVVKVTPSRGAPYYMYEGSQHSGVDRSKDGTSPVYWKLYSW